ncbi:hypothetical protein JM16_002460 [Phytophthora kernoviae]|uniref:protein-tyrosine-phosphatase n=1 Tax=Phytophthora kernoviae TaxID=325452 RepID=A0A8T0M4Z9_9STRA|nr:hypothetical protein JM16_002460 [Phytophthora kernoviae]
MTSIRKSPSLRLQTSIVQDNIPVEIATGLFVGSVHAAFNVEALKSSKITHVLNLAGSYATFPEDFTYLSLSIRDKEYASLLSCLPIAAVFIDAGLKHGGVLVHCAGGRSRSPAIAMAFLMMKQQLSYSAIITHVKTLRPVVSLNAGFDAQLKCLESARGNVFIANQHLLKARLGRLAQQHQDDQLVNEVAKKRRQCQQQSSDSPSPPFLKNQSSLDMLASGCDNRGMIGERVPSGFCLSIPGMDLSKPVAGKPPISSFIPALRSMGTMFGCQNCGENLFCAGAIVYHHEIEQLTEAASSNDRVTRFLDALQGRNAAARVISEDVAITSAKESSIKKPLLAKLRLRPQSPSVTVGNGSHTHPNGTPDRRKSVSSVLTKSAQDNGQSQKSEDSEGGLPQPLQILQAPRRSATEDNKPVISSPNKANGEIRKKPGGGIEGLWRSLTPFKSSKRATKAAPDDMKTRGQPSRTGSFELKKHFFAIDDSCSSSVGRTPAHLGFLKRNAMEWQRSVAQLVDINKDSTEAKEHESTMNQMAALLDEDSAVLMNLNNCKQWFVDPQSWTLSQVTTSPEGKICCPTEACGAIVGEWRWEGLRCVFQ